MEANPSSANSNRSILILGMHRSGTSALTRVLNMMGAYVGESEDLLPAHPIDNPTGYWERIKLVVEHDRFLTECGYAWNKLGGFDLRQIDIEKRDNLSARLKHIIGQIPAPNAPLLFKDPRLCVLLSVWHAVLDDPIHLIAVRDPREIAASMLESHRGSYTSHFLLALWEKYLRTALEELRGRQILFVSYPHLLAEPEAQSTRLLDGLKQLGVNLRPASTGELKSFLDPRLRRSTIKPHIQLNSAQRSLYSWLEEQCSVAGPVQVADFSRDASPDSELREFEKVLHDREEQIRSAAFSEVANQITKLESAMNVERAQLLDMLTSLNDQIEQIRAQTTLLESETAGLRRQHMLVKTEHEQYERAIAGHVEGGKLLSQRISALESMRNQYQQNLAQLSSDNAIIQERIRQLECENQSQAQQIVQLSKKKKGWGMINFYLSRRTAG